MVRGVGNLDHQDWRTFNSERRKSECRNFVDGDLIEQFLDLSGASMASVATKMSISVEDLCKEVEELMRLH